MSYFVPMQHETLEQFFERVYREIRACYRNKTKRPMLSKMFRKGFKLYREERRKLYHERSMQRLELEGAGSREGERYCNQLADGKIEKRNPGSQGGRSSVWRAREARERYLREAEDNGYCKVCDKEIVSDKAKVLCVDPREITRKYAAVICKSCSQGRNIKMQSRIGEKAWHRISLFEDSNIRAWLRWKCATVPDDKLAKFRSYLMKLDRRVHPRR